MAGQRGNRKEPAETEYLSRTHVSTTYLPRNHASIDMHKSNIYIYVCVYTYIYIYACLSNTVPTTTTTIAAVQAAWDVGNARGNVQSTKNSARLCAHGPVQGHQAVLAGSPLVRGRSSWDYGRTRRVQILIIY
jgi:hypothetical protein